MYDKITTHQSFHGERDIILAVVDFIVDQGYAPFKSIEKMIEDAFTLNNSDHLYLEDTGQIRIHKIIQNLQNHQTLEMLSGYDIVSVSALGTEWKSGFALRSYARRHKIPLLRKTVDKPTVISNSARERVSKDVLVRKLMWKAHGKLEMPEYSIDSLSLRVVVLTAYEKNPSVSPGQLYDMTEAILESYTK